MATDPVVSFQFSAAGSAAAPKVQANFDDLLKYIRDRNDGTVAWDSLVVTGGSTFNTAITITPTTNQIILGTTRTATLTAPTPATTSRVYTFPDLVGNYSVVGTIGTQTISGTKTFDGQLIGKGSVAGDAAAAGYIGEEIRSAQDTATNFPTSTQYGDLTSITLTAGDWSISAVIVAILNGSTTTTVEVGISENSGNSGTGLVAGDNQVDFTPPNATTAPTTASIPDFRVSQGGTNTYFLKYRATFSAGTPQARGRISARRLR